MFIGMLNIAAAIILSAVSAYFSVTGIVTIFSGATLGAAMMGAALEFSKIGATIWLYSWWKKASRLLKYYLTFAVAVLILISSIGIYGYLAKAYIGQRNPGQELENRIERIDRSIAREERVIESAQSALDQLDAALDRLIELDYLGYGLDKREEQAEEREQLKQEIENAEDEISTLLDQRFELENQLNDFSVDVGPVQYIAILLYGEEDAESYFDNAVRVLIIMLVLVFDPFAVLMMVSGNIALDGARTSRKRRRRRKNRGKSKTTTRKEKKSATNDSGKVESPSSKKSDAVKSLPMEESDKEAPRQLGPENREEGNETVVRNKTSDHKVVVDMSNYVDPEEIKQLKGSTEHLPFRKKRRQDNG